MPLADELTIRVHPFVRRRAYNRFDGMKLPDPTEAQPGSTSLPLAAIPRIRAVINSSFGVFTIRPPSFRWRG